MILPGVALVLAAVGPVPPTAVRRIEALQASGYRFRFADLDLLVLATRDARLWRALERPDSLRRVIERALRARAHIARETTDLDEGVSSLDRLDRTDYLRIALVLATLEEQETAREIARRVAAARAEDVEIGGVIYREEGDAAWRFLPSSSPQALRYRRPESPRFPVELAGFHVHATLEDDAWAAGPSLMDALGAAFDGRPRILATDLGDGRFDVDYYRDVHDRGATDGPTERLAIVDVDLGIYDATGPDRPTRD